MRLADRVAYINHDVDDAIRAGILSGDSIPEEIINVLGSKHSSRIDTITRDIIEYSMGQNEISMSPGVYFVVDSFHSFMYENVYKNPTAKSEESKVYGILSGIFEYYVKNPEKLPEEYKGIAEKDGILRAVCDYVSGMTDTYAVYIFSEIFIPGAWTCLLYTSRCV